MCRFISISSALFSSEKLGISMWPLYSISDPETIAENEISTIHS